jgi:hypothetical protein
MIISFLGTKNNNKNNMVFNKNNSINTILNPWTITDYVEAEDNFLISVYSYNYRET